MVKMKQHKALNQKISSFLPKTQKEPKTFSSLYFNFYVFQLKRKQSNKKKKRKFFVCSYHRAEAKQQKNVLHCYL